jgi:Domain of unknown function (DUF4328)/Protein of unknown function (DUF2510)
VSHVPPPPGWYPDPWREAPWRWWDGGAWTPHTSQPQRPTPWLLPHVAVEAERGVAHWLRIVVLVDAALFVLQLVGMGAAWRETARAIRDDTDSSSSALALLQVFALVALAAAILRLIWLMRAAEAGKRLGRPARREPGLAGAGWIIPVVSLWWPYQDVKALVPPEHPDRRRLGWWWGFRLIGQFSFIAVIITGFHPVGFQVVAVAVGALAYMAAALIERDLIATILAHHEEWLHHSSP